ncbi:MAG: HNH endonuclease domain-containing protein [Desulfomonilaceae bacterium]
MLEKEFGGLCAYCGKPSDKLMEREHILPRSQFFFDSYLNLLPACTQCNAEKGRRRPGDASLHISQEAYERYDAYLREVGRQRPLHFLQSEKKGILNLMRDPNRAWEVERYLSLIANNFASIVQSQRGPRPFARFLYSKLSARQEKPPEIEFRSGRHIALYRNIAFPDFQKDQDKSEGGRVNHALDAMLLASQLPDPRRLEARGINFHEMGTWRRKVASRAPQAGKDGIPAMQRYNWYVPGFESVDGNGYVEMEMGSMNWNQKDSATHKLDPYGWSEKASKPTKRTSALELYEQLAKEKDKVKLERLVATIHHPALREVMAKALEKASPGPAVAEAMKTWLLKSVANSINSSTFSKHPADMRRKQDLERFAADTNAPIPRVIGIKRFDMGVQGKIDLERTDPMTGKTGHRYMTQPANRAVVLAYPRGSDGKADLSKPFTASVRQNFALRTEIAKIFAPKPVELEKGIIWGDKNSLRGGWKSILENYLTDCGFHSYTLLTPCCIVCYEDRTQWFIRNFEKETFKKTKILKHVVGVRKNPFTSRVLPLKVLTPKAEKS